MLDASRAARWNCPAFTHRVKVQELFVDLISLDIVDLNELIWLAFRRKGNAKDSWGEPHILGNLSRGGNFPATSRFAMSQISVRDDVNRLVEV